MPTPFYHLSIADELLEGETLPEDMRAFLHQQRGAFYLGKTAPDVQTISGQPRPETHFYHVPLVGRTPPWERMFHRYPTLEWADKLSPEQAAFMAGYICHLQADIIWITDLFVPYFLPLMRYTKRRQVGFIHNVMRSWLDEQIVPHLAKDVSPRLEGAQPNGWLPFVQSRFLLEWRSYLAGQLAPGAKSQTVEVFAARAHMPVESFFELMHSDARMEAEVFSVIPQDVLVEYRQKLVHANTELLQSYLADVT
jgi:hypothetical protein